MALDCPYLYHTALLTCSFCTCEFPEVLLGKARDEGAEFLFSCYCMEMEEKGKEQGKGLTDHFNLIVSKYAQIQLHLPYFMSKSFLDVSATKC